MYLQRLTRVYKSTDGILSHCEAVLDVAIVYLCVYHALPVILRNSSISCGGPT